MKAFVWEWEWNMNYLNNGVHGKEWMNERTMNEHLRTNCHQNLASNFKQHMITPVMDGRAVHPQKLPRNFHQPTLSPNPLLNYVIAAMGLFMQI